ncbi:helix-turn-helix domain-containing protein [Ramlibacter sp. G-1-2-2]|uniref:citrate synthase (unknown stereospecificity) n=1 Tax=Ramlibacter agri TaxID=2728837 RepID=A0A848H567_9BURK|nr:citrate synthase [Ramlibacter agri]NML44671.1 helix-turn-helix domain-containing protein [Ramlibacter agri]
MSQPSRPTANYLSAAEATRLLGVKLQTLYAYVSRGLIRSTNRVGRKERLYLREDVERVHARAQARAGHGAVAADAMNHGQPIIPTAITEITPEGPRYRGRLATELASEGASFEAVAQLLWSGAWQPEAPAWQVQPAAGEFVALVDGFGAMAQRNPVLEVFAVAVLHLGLQRRAEAAGLPLETRIFEEARQIIGHLVGCCGLASAAQRFVPPRGGDRIAAGVLRALGGAATDTNVATVSALLALLADHELAPGTLSVRVAASGGATLHGCIAAALCASAGLVVAHRFDEIYDFLERGGERAGWVREAVQRHAQGTPMPGFGHPLYPQGDPRGTMLLAFIREQRPDPGLLAVCDFIEEVEQVTGQRVRHELPMVALTRAMGLPRPAASAIFLVSRTAGWVAHIQEQRASGQLLRPRARYTPAGDAAAGAFNNQS